MTSGSIQILNSIGQSVKAYSFDNQELLQLNISGLPKGIYVVKLYYEDEQVASTRKIIKE